MRTTLVVCLLLLLGLVPRLGAATDPADRFLEAYFLIQEADQAEQQGAWAKAHAKFSAALDILHELKTQSPKWNPLIIEFRVGYCGEHLAALAAKLPAAPAPVTSASAPAAPAQAAAPAPSTPAAAPPAPAPRPEDTARLDKLTADLQHAQEKIHQLETDRADLNAKLKTALREVPPTATSLRIEQLLEKNKDLAAQFAAARQQITDLKAQTAELPQLRTQVRELTSTRNDLSTKLADALAKVAASQTSPRVEELLRKNEDLAAQLAAAQAQLAKSGERPRETTAASQQAPIKSQLAELQTRLASTQAELQRTRAELIAARQDLGRARQDLESARAENRTLRETYQQMAARVADAAKNLEAAHLAGQKDNEIIQSLRKENQLLRQIVNQKTVLASAEPAETGPSIPELIGWKPHHPITHRAVAGRAPQPPAATMPAMKESARSTLVAELIAPPAGPAAVPARPPSAETGGTLSAPLAGAGAQAAAVPRAEAPPSLGPASDKTRRLIAEARAAVAAKDYPTAAARYEAVLAAEPSNLLALSNLAVVRYQQGRLDDAEQGLRRAVALAPNDSESRSLLGLVYFRKGKLEEAFGELTRAVALNPRNAEAHNYLGITLSEKGWGAAAELEIRRAIELNPQYADAHFNLAVLYASQRPPRSELARHHYQRALELGAQPDPVLAAKLKSGGKVQPPKAEALPNR